MATGKRPDGNVFASGANEGEVLDFPAITRGWGVTVDGKDPDGKTVTDPTNGIPPMEWFNALQKRTDEAIQWLLQHALPEWAAGTWPAGAIVVNGGIVWRAQKETAAEPAADDGDWLALFPLANLDLRYLRADKNLSDLKDAAEAREALGLDQVGNWPAVEANGGLHSSGNHRIYIDWGEDGKAHLTIDTSDEGELLTTLNLPTAAQTGAYPITGGRLAGAVSAETGGEGLQKPASAWSTAATANIITRAFGQDGENNAWTDLYLNNGNYWAYRICLQISGGTHVLEFRSDNSLRVKGPVYAGDAFVATDGNLHGALWGGPLSDWINGQITNLNNSISGVNGTATDAWNKANDAQSNRVSGVKLGAMGWIASISDGPGNGYTGGGGTVQTVPAGCTVIGGTNNGTSNLAGLGFFYRPLMVSVNGQWVTIGQD